MSVVRLSPPIQFKASPNVQGEFSGYASTVGNIDSYGDLVAPGAFQRTLLQHKAEKTMPALLLAHEHDIPIGVWLELSEDDRGLKAKGKLSMGTTRAREAYELMRDGALSGLSIGYQAVRTEKDKSGNRLLKEIHLREISLVTFPANQSARVAEVKAAILSSPLELQRTAQDVLGLSQKEAKRLVAGGWKALTRTTDESQTSAEFEALARQLRGITEQLRS